MGHSRFAGHQSAERQMVEGRSSDELSRMGFLPDGRWLDISAGLYVETELPAWDPHSLHRLDSDHRGRHEIILKAFAVHLSVPGTRRFCELYPSGFLWLQARIRTLQRSLARSARERLLYARAAIRSENRLSLFPVEPMANSRRFVALHSIRSTGGTRERNSDSVLVLHTVFLRRRNLSLSRRNLPFCVAGNWIARVC